MYILFDIGGTNMRIACSKDGTEISDVCVVPTPQDFEEAMQIFEEHARTLGGDKITHLCGAVAGVFDARFERLVCAPHLSGWAGKPIKEEFARRFSTPVYLRNDAELAALAEARIGAGKDTEIVAYLSVGTGVGGARIVGGKIDARRTGFEPGHQIVEMPAEALAEMSPSPTGALKKLEDYVSGSALEREMEVQPKNISDPKIWNKIATRLAVGVHNTLMYWSPDVVVLGGSMILGKNSIRVKDVAKYTRAYTKIFSEIPEIKAAQLGDRAGLEGARLYLLDLEPQVPNA